MSILDALSHELVRHKPFSELLPDELDELLAGSNIVKFSPGERLLRPDEMSPYVYLVLDGDVRIIGLLPDGKEQITIGKRSAGQLLGWVNILRGSPTEFVQASTTVTALSISTELFVNALQTNQLFLAHFLQLTSISEAYHVLLAAAELSPVKQVGWADSLHEAVIHVKAASISDGNLEEIHEHQPDGWHWRVSTPGVPGHPVGTVVDQTNLGKIERPGLAFPPRLLCLPPLESIVQPPSISTEVLSSDQLVAKHLSLSELGILEDDNLQDDQKYPLIRASGDLNIAMAVSEMVALKFDVPFRKDSIRKLIEDQFRRNKPLSIELLAGVLEIIGLNCQLAEAPSEYIGSIEPPAVLFYEDCPVVYYGIVDKKVLLAHPKQGFLKISNSDFSATIGDKIRFVLPKRVASTPTSRFGWSWFTPLLAKYKLALALVFASSLLAQLFGLAIPLLLQQIIDKVLSQGNVSSLNVLGAAMVLMALFQGFLQALRTFIFVDTTDRMDLTLGSAVIDRLLALPLGFFEKRPVGELSQRLGELNNIRSFLTGTALLSVLSLVFATLYLIVMFIYSPLLSVVALSTFPLYLLLVFTVSPIYKGLIRKRAVAQAKTQSHLIEVIGGIQTVKAQHFELTARWKWQDRYREFVNQGFKSTALGSTAGEIGSFLNQVSGLLVLWIGMTLVLKGEFTLGQLIAFRIISGNVTGPLLQLAGLYQGFQGVQLSMERLSDIIDQPSEIQDSVSGQIALPPISGAIRFENINFRFGSSGPYQLDRATLEVEPGSFVGVVGQSGSGKSTLMKLLPRLYEPESGRIFIDNYDIQKVDLRSLRRQIGIVPQDSLLFEGTIAENIALNDPQATDDMIIEAAKIACAHDFIMSLGLGYATHISEKGSNLSGGQRQRIAIARTIIANPQLLVMDEATSALDYETERQLCLNLQTWSQKKTVFFITHRLTTIRNADKIVVMSSGKVAEIGRHDELIDLRGIYATLYSQQSSAC